MYDVKSLLSGMTGLSTANPYPVFKVGDGVNNNEKRILKFINDRDRVMKGELNPKFFMWKELDCFLPDDWRLEVSIYDQGTFTDSLIGLTVIDLENRMYSNLLWVDKHAVKIELENIKD